MGQSRIIIDVVGDHGCCREVKEGGKVYGCGRMGCIDCQAREFVEQLKRRNGNVIMASHAHWPQDVDYGRGNALPDPGATKVVDGEVTDNLITRERRGNFK